MQKPTKRSGFGRNKIFGNFDITKNTAFELIPNFILSGPLHQMHLIFPS